ncbi:MAG: hypothetical protein ACI977_000835 [Candidatus Nanohaloarchaea archaeon]|jgi:hypothetical protein
MEIEEEVTRRRQTIELEDPNQAYAELRDLLSTRMSFDHVSEEKYFNDVDEGVIRARVETIEAFDRYSKEELELYLKIDKNKGEMDLQIKGIIITEYPESYSYQKSLWYYAYRSLFDKFLYGEVRHGYIPAVEEKTDQVMERVRDLLER